MKNFYLTTPLYYVNDVPHIGHAYTTILADVLSRYMKFLGKETFLMTGTDEHGQKVQQAAQKFGTTPQDHVDQYNTRFKTLWEKVNVKYDKFIRTTDEDHKEFVKTKLQELWDRDLIYSKEYSGWYSVSEERFFNEDELVDGKDPVSNKAVEWVSEKNYFFKMSQFQDELIKTFTENADMIQPDFRKNEVLGFLKKDLQDLCISRPKSRLSWGIDLPFDKEYVTYVWFDALLNYASGVDGKTFEDGNPLWPADYHLIGKDILTTHAIYWISMLLALKMPLPKHILAHGWWLNGGAKMSKSSGTAINPIPYIKKFGVDPFRYYLMRDMVLGQDASFTDDNYIRRLNSDLANDLGNGLNRVYKLVQSHFDGQLPRVLAWEADEEELFTFTESAVRRTLALIENFKLSQALEEAMSLVRAVNKYLENRAPWKLAKDENMRPLLATTLSTAAETLRITFNLLQPVMPTLAEEGLTMLGAKYEGLEGCKYTRRESETKLGEHKVLFQRIEQEKKPAEAAPKKLHPLSNLDLKVAQIKEIAAHPEADGLWVLQVDDGTDMRQVCAGIKANYSAEDLQDRKVVLLANLKPAKLRGLKSSGMLLAADHNEGASLLEVKDLEVGTGLMWGTHERSPKAKLNVKEFNKLEIKALNGNIICQDSQLQTEDSKGQIFTIANDGAEIH
ncbi:methionine--tRNA ligase [Fibrobacterales bacterium]|nr:methionine--tRNA ligase [Fibrobacterales bacterium]